MTYRLLAGLLGWAVLFPWVPALRAAEFTLQDGDRVVLLGSTLIEREQRSAYWETALTTRFADRNVTFRNLGWSGDTVFGHARARFGSTADGFRHLKDHVTALKPTVILVGYGTNEAFEGEAGLASFRLGLTHLLDTLGTTQARIVLVSPLRHEDLGRPLPDPTEQNRNVASYRDALRETAQKRGLPFVDLHDRLGTGGATSAPLTDNGIHLTPFGYWRSAAAIEAELGWKPCSWEIDLDASGKVSRSVGTQVNELQTGPLRFRVIDTRLPPAPAPAGGPRNAAWAGSVRVLRVRGLKPGSHSLRIDDREIVSASAAEWAAGVPLTRGPEFDQVERLRTSIIEKNQLYFHRWRPQNETYLFGFRKHEQGQNAREIPLFDPLVAQLEAEIARRRVPVPHRYELIPSAR